MRISDWSSDVCSSDLLDQSRKQRRLRGVEFFGLAVEIMERGGTQPIAIVAEIGVRQIAFENLVLGQPRFQPEGDQRLARLAAEGLLGREEGEFGELLDRKSTRLNSSH